MFDDDDDRQDTRRSLVLLVFLLGVPLLGVLGAFAAALLSVFKG